MFDPRSSTLQCEGRRGREWKDGGEGDDNGEGGGREKDGWERAKERVA